MCSSRVKTLNRTLLLLAAGLALTLADITIVGQIPMAKPRAARPRPTIVPVERTEVLADRLRTVNAATASVERRNSSFASVSRLQQYLQAQEAEGKKEWSYLDAYVYWLRQRAFPNDTVNWADYTVAFTKRDLMAQAELNAPSPFAARPNWEFVGPQNLPVPYRQYYGEGSTSGRVNGAAFDPRNPGTYYIATAGGGVWKTTDRGKTWSSVSDGPEWTSLKTSSVAIDSVHNIVYVGTGDFDGGISVYGFGLMVSDDGGVTWSSQLRSELSGQSIRRIVIDPENPDVVTITAGRGFYEWGKVWRTTNRGRTWDAVIKTEADWSDVEYGAPLGDGTNNRIYYAVGNSGRGGEVWRQMNRGETWTKLTFPFIAQDQLGLDICTSLTDPKTVYLLSASDRAIWKSLDAGDSWQNITGNFPNDMPVPQTANYNWSHPDRFAYTWNITCSKRADTGKDILYVGLIDLVASTDGGVSWESIGKSYYGDSLIHNDQHYLAVNPQNPNEMLIGNDGGVYRLTYDPASNSPWTLDTTLNATLGLTQFYQSAYHPTDPNQIIGGAQDNATPFSVSGGGANASLARWLNVGGGDGGYCAINASDPKIQYATEQNLIIHRTGNAWGSIADGQSSSTDITYTTKVQTAAGDKIVNWSRDPVNFIAPIAIDPNNPNRLYAGTNYLWLWDDRAFDAQNVRAGWQRHLGGQKLANGQDAVLTHIAIAPSDSNRIYTGASTGEVWMSKDAGNSWLQINGGGPGLPQQWVTNIAVNPRNPNDILVGLSGTSSPTAQHPGHLWECADTMAASRTWKNLSGSGLTALPNIPLNTIAIDPQDPTRVYYVGTDAGVFVTNNGGANWANATNNLGLPNVQVNDLRIVRGTGYLMAATYGRGIWRLKLPAGSSARNVTFRSSNRTRFDINQLSGMIRAMEDGYRTNLKVRQ